MAKNEILNNSKTRLRLFESGIEMDESLPKHIEPENIDQLSLF